jgi:hypothetical protein
MKKNDIILILLPLFLFVIAWIGFSIYHNIATSTISEPLAVQIEPITPTFDTNTIDSLKTRETISPDYELTNTLVSPTPTPTQISASPSATTNNSLTTPQATTEGSLAQ